MARRRIARFFMYFFLSVGAIIMIFPFFWISARGWPQETSAVISAIRLPGFSIQPAEFSKILLLIFFGIARPDYLGVLLAVFAGKLIKYTAFAWITRRAPALFQNGTNGRRWRFAFWRKGDGQ